MWIKRDVVMLPTNEKVTSSIMLGVMPNVAALTKDVLGDTHDWMKFGKPQHLYFLSDEEIKEGDWCYRDTGTIFQMTKELSEYYKSTRGTDVHKRYKIIATTDKSLIEESRLMRECFPLTIGLPSPSFIEKFVVEYNKGNIITEVLVEYNDWFANGYDGKIIPTSLKINPKDNTITIRKVKDSWNREEIIKLINKISEEVDFESATQKTIDKWIEENLK